MDDSFIQLGLFLSVTAITNVLNVILKERIVAAGMGIMALRAFSHSFQRRVNVLVVQSLIKFIVTLQADLRLVHFDLLGGDRSWRPEESNQ